jgi:hypothetical protein
MNAGDQLSPIVKSKLQTFANFAEAPRSSDNVIQFRFFAPPSLSRGRAG